MSAELVKRADALRADFASKESQKGSGYHDDDARTRGETVRFIAPQKQPNDYNPDKLHPKMSTAVVHFTDHTDDEVQVFAGGDAEKVFSAARSWAADTQGRPFQSLTGTERTLLFRIVPRLKIDASGSVPVLRVRMSDWNDVVFLLRYQNIAIAGLPLKG